MHKNVSVAARPEAIVLQLQAAIEAIEAGQTYTIPIEGNGDDQPNLALEFSPDKTAEWEGLIADWS